MSTSAAISGDARGARNPPERVVGPAPELTQPKIVLSSPHPLLAAGLRQPTKAPPHPSPTQLYPTILTLAISFHFPNLQDEIPFYDEAQLDQNLPFYAQLQHPEPQLDQSFFEEAFDMELCGEDVQAEYEDDQLEQCFHEEPTMYDTYDTDGEDYGTDDPLSAPMDLDMCGDFIFADDEPMGCQG